MSTEPLHNAVAALRSFVHLSGALRAQALLPGDPPALVSCTRMGPLEVLVGEREVALPHDADVDVPAPDLGDLRPLAPFAVDPARGEVAGAIGGLDALADATRRLAAAIGAGAAVVVEVETTTPDVALALSARAGEPVLVTLGEDCYEL